MEYSGSGPSGVCMLTARPWKQGMVLAVRVEELLFLRVDAMTAGFDRCEEV
jgi:hypothetical protein